MRSLEMTSSDLELPRWNNFPGDIGTQCGDIGTQGGNIFALRNNIGTHRGVSGDIGDCNVGITLQMSNRVPNPSDMGIFSRPGKVWMLFVNVQCLDNCADV